MKHGAESLIMLIVILLITACSPTPALVKVEQQKGQLKVGFDIDDTILFTRDNFLKAPALSDDPDHLDYAWINTHDSLYSTLIKPVADLVWFYRAHGHDVFFITARPGINGDAVGRFLSSELDFPVELGKNLFFSPKQKDPATGKKYTTKHHLISELGLHLYFGDSDTDMIAASIAGVRAVRVVRDQRSVDAYSSNYFGDLKSDPEKRAPFGDVNYQTFLTRGVGPFGETIYPIYINTEDVNQSQE
ncbi:MAG: hypothetical protein K9M49_07200 [Candidatus Marinimicrobia bacterium]|nr:hypothetical protein [Candidatus Neomarinimicrobiota bacterium]MCF7850356.1 hypothetical protein [Candidatus Neomarinimicrobiota bacterium]MCF7904927.1 hypothetical protein [Candidatus Neomarinimicrobiota bacterium]